MIDERVKRTLISPDRKVRLPLGRPGCPVRLASNPTGEGGPDISHDHQQIAGVDGALWRQAQFGLGSLSVKVWVADPRGGWRLRRDHARWRAALGDGRSMCRWVVQTPESGIWWRDHRLSVAGEANWLGVLGAGEAGEMGEEVILVADDPMWQQDERVVEVPVPESTRGQAARALFTSRGLVDPTGQNHGLAVVGFMRRMGTTLMNGLLQAVQSASETGAYLAAKVGAAGASTGFGTSDQWSKFAVAVVAVQPAVTGPQMGQWLSQPFMAWANAEHGTRVEVTVPRVGDGDVWPIIEADVFQTFAVNIEVGVPTVDGNWAWTELPMTTNFVWDTHPGHRRFENQSGVDLAPEFGMPVLPNPLIGTSGADGELRVVKFRLKSDDELTGVVRVRWVERNSRAW